MIIGTFFKTEKKTETEKIVAPLRLLQKHYHSSEIAYFHLNCDCSFDRLLTSWPDHPSERDTDLKRIFFPRLIQYSFKCLFKGDFSLNAKFDPSHLSVLKFKDDLELQTEKQALNQRLFFISFPVPWEKGAWICLLCFPSPHICVVMRPTGAIVWRAGGQRYQSPIKSGSIQQHVDQIPGLKEGSRRKKLASGFHFIPDRLNEAHGEGTRVTFSGWQAGCCVKRTARRGEDCWWGRGSGTERGGCLVKSKQRVGASSPSSGRRAGGCERSSQTSRNSAKIQRPYTANVFVTVPPETKHQWLCFQ